MLSKILHRAPPPPNLTVEQRLKNIAARENVRDPKHLSSAQVDFFAEYLDQLRRSNNGKAATEEFFRRMAFENVNTSYIEPFVEAAYANNHPRKEFIGKLYAAFAVANDPDHLVSKMLDDRFYSDALFPLYSFFLLGQAGVELQVNRRETFLYRALASTASVEHIKTCCNLLKLDPNGVKDARQRTLLHRLMDSSKKNSSAEDERNERVLERGGKLGLATTQDIYGCYPDEFGTTKMQHVFAKYFESNTGALQFFKLSSYLQKTLHNFEGLQSIGTRNAEVYLKSENPLVSNKKTTLFEHILQSNDMNIISDLQRLIEPHLRQHNDIESTLPYVFLESYVCGNNPQQDTADSVFAMLQEKSPRDLSTALGFLLMRSSNYLNNYGVAIGNLSAHRDDLEKILNHQLQIGLLDLVTLEVARLEIVAPFKHTTFAPSV